MDELTPLQVLLELMRKYEKEENREKAALLARYAAPYVHGKVQAARGGGHYSEVTDEELEAYFGGGEAAADEDPRGAG